MRINSLPLFNRPRRRQTREYLSNEDYSWIWEPFKDAKDSKLAKTACLAAEIIANSSPDKIPKVQFNLDPRIVIPLCAIALQKELNNLDKINQVNTQEFDYREDVIDYFLEITKPSPRWRYLFNSLSPELQYQLCYRLSNYRLPTKNDWRNLFKNNSYQFNRSLDYAFILAILLVICFLAIIGMYSFVIVDINIFLRILVIWSFVPLLILWFYIFNLDDYVELLILGFSGFSLVLVINQYRFLLYMIVVFFLIIFTYIIYNYLIIKIINYLNKMRGKILKIIAVIIGVSSCSLIGAAITSIIEDIVGFIVALIIGFIIGWIVGFIIVVILWSIGEEIEENIKCSILRLEIDETLIFYEIPVLIENPLIETSNINTSNMETSNINTFNKFSVFHLFFSFLSPLYFLNYCLVITLSLKVIETWLFLLISLGISATLYLRGITRDYEARNPLKGILNNTINN